MFCTYVLRLCVCVFFVHLCREQVCVWLHYVIHIHVYTYICNYMYMYVHVYLYIIYMYVRMYDYTSQSIISLHTVFSIIIRTCTYMYTFFTTTIHTCTCTTINDTVRLGLSRSSGFFFYWWLTFSLASSSPWWVGRSQYDNHIHLSVHVCSVYMYMYVHYTIHYI